ncbi:hypothetical protein M9H77_26806 [Catharanthus roseus]|uniref:Uncharacterized protein n=1 Tax=Catharanthus roseus TaxID=4058 RepID=A0ACC0AEZ6_CATRO|nr:hypothetical protein M9H77_26806 [Catharanthus roseus]
MKKTMNAIIIGLVLMTDITLMLRVGMLMKKGGDSERDECSEEKENDLEKNEQTKEIREEKRENSKEEDHFTFPYSLGTYLERRYFIEFNSISCAIPRIDDYDFNIANCVSCVLGVEDRRSMEKELDPIFEDLSVSLSLNPSSLGYEISLEELKSLLDSHTFQVSLMGDMCIIAFEGNLFLLVMSMTNYLSSHFSLKDPLMSSSVMFDPSR